MTLYERGFGDGERASFRDRMRGRRRVPRVIESEMNAYERAWWDGYRPRSAQWWVTGKAWWMEREADQVAA